MFSIFLFQSAFAIFNQGEFCFPDCFIQWIVWGKNSQSKCPTLQTYVPNFHPMSLSKGLVISASAEELGAHVWAQECSPVTKFCE